MKNNVLFFKDWYEAIREFSEEERLRAYDAIMQYAFEGVVPTDKFIKAATALMRTSIDRDTSKYEEVSRKRAEAVSKRWQAYKSMQQHTNRTNATTSTDKDKGTDNGKEKEMDSEPTIVGDKEKEKTSNEVKKKVASTQVRRFVKPTPSEVQAYCDERGNGISGEAFCNFYESKGWLIGKSPMKDWKAAVRTWEAKDGRSKPKNAKGQQLGAGEWIENGVRYYGSGHQVPMSAPPRPSENSYWSGESNSWVSGV